MNYQHFRSLLTFLVFSFSCQYSAHAALVDLSHAPLFVTNAQKANVLVILDNSNSMDESANGSAVGGASADSKSEIARAAVKNLVTTYTNKINMGLMAYQQSGVSLRHLHNSPYDASFDPANYDPTFTGSRDSLTKRFRVPNVANPGNFIHYNIALPFYSSSNYGSAYCYSTTADFDNGAETYPAGPWDSYRCFQNNSKTNDSIPTWNNSASESAAGFSSYWFGGGFSPTDSDLAQNLLDFGTFLTWDWVSQTWFSNSSPGRGYLHTEIKDLDSSQATLLNAKLATSQFVTNAPTDPTQPLQNAGLTPLEGTLLTAKDYFSGTTLPANEGGPAAALPESCDKDFIALLTDGLPSTDSTGTVTTNTTTALAAVATAAQQLNTDGVETYTIGFALPVGTDPTALDSIAAAGGTGTAYLADDPTTLQAKFDTIFSDILAKTGASASAATNSTSLSLNSFVYQARFNSGNWSGELLAKSIGSGTISSTVTWNAATELSAKAATDRVILTYGRDTNDGIPFRWSNISSLTDTTTKDALNIDPLTSTADALGSDRVDFIRGGTGGSSSGVFRSDRLGKLGDIIHSTPNYVGPPNAGYSDSENSGYSAFRLSQASRTPILYTGANDGMLHGFDAATGEEILAYIPREVIPKLNLLTAQGYGSSIPHSYYVDGAPMVADADVNGWKTVLIGGLNGGGQGLYALDITNPDVSTFSEANAADVVLWEFTDEDDADLGYTYNQAANNQLTNQSNQIVKMANGEWAVIIGNGYNNTEADGNASTTGHAYLFIIFIDEGIDGTWSTGDYIKLDTGAGSTSQPNGLATPTPIDTDGDGDIDFVYAGDLEGNMWKFDVSSSNSSSWGITISGNKPLYIAKDSSNNLQPITSAPLITPHPSTGYLVGFGTGKYLGVSDISSTSTQSIYTIWDKDTNITNRTKLVEQTVLNEQTVNGNKYRVTSENSVDFSTKSGWFMDLPESGERVDINPVIRDYRFVFVTRTPSSAVCDAGGTSWLMELDYLTGGRLELSPFDINGDGIINDQDFVTLGLGVDLDNDGNEDTITVPASGYQDSTGGMLTTPTILEKPDELDEEIKILADSKGQITSILESVDTQYRGRISWEEIR
jgi:type IV pilus assembly protein PilY1